MTYPSFKAVSDRALLVELGTAVDEQLSQTIVTLDCAIAQADITGLSEVVPALVNLLIIFDPLLTDHASVQAVVEGLFPLDSAAHQAGKTHVLDVCYDDEFGVDLEAVASACGMSAEAVINAHCDSSYSVSMYGFAPGYAYLTGVPAAIQVPRKPTAVRDVPAGSVIIAGPQCLTTTLTMPTGWSILGRSTAQIFTGDTQHAFLFDVGDRVEFRRITRSAFDEASV